MRSRKELRTTLLVKEQQRNALLPKSLGSGKIEKRESRRMWCQSLREKKSCVEEGELRMSKFSKNSSNIRTESILEFSDQEIIGNRGVSE